MSERTADKSRRSQLIPMEKGPDLPFDRLLFASRLKSGNVPNRLVPNTALVQEDELIVHCENGLEADEETQRGACVGDALDSE